jgi:hypothetical protein
MDPRCVPAHWALEESVKLFDSCFNSQRDAQAFPNNWEVYNEQSGGVFGYKGLERQNQTAYVSLSIQVWAALRTNRIRPLRLNLAHLPQPDKPILGIIQVFPYIYYVPR